MCHGPQAARDLADVYVRFLKGKWSNRQLEALMPDRADLGDMVAELEQYKESMGALAVRARVEAYR
jgi:hypothetical protein